MPDTERVPAPLSFAVPSAGRVLSGEARTRLRTQLKNALSAELAAFGATHGLRATQDTLDRPDQDTLGRPEMGSCLCADHSADHSLSV